MKLHKTFILLLLLTCISVGGIALAEPERGEMRGTFIKRAEQVVGEREYLAIVVKPLERDEHVSILIPRENDDFMHVARNLREGQRLGLVYVVEHDKKWLQRIEVDRSERRDPPRERKPERRRPEGDRGREVAPREGDRHPPMREGMELRRALGENIERLMGNYRRLIAQFEQMEQELRRLRAENEGLRAENARLRRAAGVQEPRRTDRRGEGEVRREGEEGRERPEREARRDREVQREGEREDR